MPDETTLENETHPAQPAPAKGPSLTDAEANRQVGRGGAPQPPAGTPEASQGPDLRAHEPDAKSSDAPASGGSQTVKVGARDVVRPIGDEDQAKGDAGGEDDLYDRLAQKDNTDTGPGPSSVA